MTKIALKLRKNQEIIDKIAKNRQKRSFSEISKKIEFWFFSQIPIFIAIFFAKHNKKTFFLLNQRFYDKTHFFFIKTGILLFLAQPPPIWDPNGGGFFFWLNLDFDAIWKIVTSKQK